MDKKLSDRSKKHAELMKVILVEFGGRTFRTMDLNKAYKAACAKAGHDPMTIQWMMQVIEDPGYMGWGSFTSKKRGYYTYTPKGEQRILDLTDGLRMEALETAEKSMIRLAEEISYQREVRIPELERCYNDLLIFINTMKRLYF